MNKRYVDQAALKGIGEKGQERLSNAKAAIVGLGGLGSFAANLLARTGIGYLRLIDGDIVELKNLHRQLLYDESDVARKIPKAEAACQHLKIINSEIQYDPVPAYLNEKNADLLYDMDLIIDGTDNYEARYLLNKICVQRKIPWIYGGVTRAKGMTMNFLPGGPCLACMTGQTSAPDKRPEDIICCRKGVLNTAPSIVASLQCTEAVKILTGSLQVRKTLQWFDQWENKFGTFEISKKTDCPICGIR